MRRVEAQQEQECLGMIEQLEDSRPRGALVDEGRVSAADFDAFLGLYDNRGFAWRDGLMMAVCGRRPAL